MLTVHHLGVSQSDRIVWLCEELGVPYTLKLYQRDPKTGMAPPEYKAIHPFGTAPVITDGDLVLGESGAIIEYIIAKHGGGRLTLKADHPDFAEYLHWLHFANGSMMPTMMLELVTTMMGSAASGGPLKALNARGTNAFDMIEKRLGAADYFGGKEFTAADIMMLFPLTTMRRYVPKDLTPFPNIRAYLKRIGARPAFQRAMKKADPDLEPMLS